MTNNSSLKTRGRPRSPDSLKPAQKQAAYRQRLIEAGLRTVTVVIPDDESSKAAITATAAQLRRDAGKLLPEEAVDGEQSTKKGRLSGLVGRDVGLDT